MTGYGQSQISRTGVLLSLDMHSLNSRFFDMTIRLPRQMQKWEAQIRQKVQAALRRGKINLTVAVTGEDEIASPARVNRTRLKQYQILFEEIREELGLTDTPRLSHFLSTGDVIDVDEQGQDDVLFELLSEALEQALHDVSEMRLAEGKNLAVDLLQRLNIVIREIEAIENLASEYRLGDVQRYRDKIQELVDNVPLEEGRLIQEAAILADRHDITEECIRFKSHMDLFQAYVKDNEDSGKRLGFLLQEMGREVNTIGAKTDHVDISHHVVRIKDELEKIREQVQNIL
ncbi:YicC/YloC family endoribonuclease [Candidatus Neomarinimicrobiota bacterium]